MSLGDVEKLIIERYASQGYAISRRNTKTLVVELPYGAQDFDEFVLDMRVNFGCKMDYDLTESAGKTVEIRITPGAHEVLQHSESEDEQPPLALPSSKDSSQRQSAQMPLCLKVFLYGSSVLGLLLVFLLIFLKLFPERAAERPGGS